MENKLYSDGVGRIFNERAEMVASVRLDEYLPLFVNAPEIRQQRDDLLAACETMLPFIAKGIADGAFKDCAAPNGAMLAMAKGLATINKAKGE